MRSTKYFMTVNILFELLIPLVGIVLLNALQINIVYPFEFTIALVISYLFYVPIVVMANFRRFPRVWHKAVAALLVPIVILSTLTFVLNLGTWLNILIACLYFFVATLIASCVEVIQKKRVPAIIMPVGFIAVFFASAFSTALFFHVSFLPICLTGRSSPHDILFLLFWFFGLSVIVSLKLHRAGRRLYATRGYRPNAAVIIINEKHEVLLCERADRPGTIQTVQGGIDPGETPEQAAVRELTEEVGIWPDQYELKAMLLGTERYEWTSDVQKKLKKTGFRGQEQYFFLVQVSSEVKFDLNFHHREFRKVWWDSPERMIQLSWSRKRPGIEKALRGFGLYKNGAKSID